MDLLDYASDSDDEPATKPEAAAPARLPSAADAFASVGAQPAFFAGAKPPTAAPALAPAPESGKRAAVADEAPAAKRQHVPRAAPEPKPVAASAPARGDSFVPRQLTKRGAGNVVTEDISSWTSDASNAARRKREVRKSESLDS